MPDCSVHLLEGVDHVRNFVIEAHQRGLAAPLSVHPNLLGQVLDLAESGRVDRVQVVGYGDARRRGWQCADMFVEGLPGIEGVGLSSSYTATHIPK